MDWGDQAQSQTCPAGERLQPAACSVVPHLLAAAVEGLLYFPPGLRHMALLQEREIVGVLEGDFQLAILCLLQRVQKVLREPSCGFRFGWL